MNEQANKKITKGIISLLRQNRFYGNIFTQLPRKIDTDLKDAFDLQYQNGQINLLYNPVILNQRYVKSDQLLLPLQHIGLHLIFKHPLRFHNGNVLSRIATDLTVDQYLDPAINQFQKFNYQFDLHLPEYQGAKTYLNLLKSAFLSKKEISKAKKFLNQAPDSHQKWNSFNEQNPMNIDATIDRVITEAWQNTDNHSRGKMNSTLVESITHHAPLTDIKWQKYLKKGFSQELWKYRPTTSRFNRRQPYRMDLNGTLPDYLQSVNIFVDNSGSMGDETIAKLLAQIGGLLKEFHPLVTMFSFDSQVHVEEHYHLKHANQLKYCRHSGGGTNFQPIFDWLHHHYDPQALNIILTDGYGEERLNYYQINNLIWVLSQPRTQFSVKNVTGTVISI